MIEEFPSQSDRDLFKESSMKPDEVFSTSSASLFFTAREELAVADVGQTPNGTSKSESFVRSTNFLCVSESMVAVVVNDDFGKNLSIHGRHLEKTNRLEHRLGPYRRFATDEAICESSWRGIHLTVAGTTRKEAGREKPRIKPNSFTNKKGGIKKLNYIIPSLIDHEFLHGWNCFEFFEAD